MNPLLVGSFSALALLFAIAPGVHADNAPQPGMVAQTANQSSSIVSQHTPPLALVQLARQGYLVQQGIPSNGDLIYAVQAGQITPENLIQAGINAGQVSSDALQDEGYLNGVREQLHDLIIFSISASVPN
ncbi:hypothetical protein [Pantanalinema sp. GBBB05]|uniref:hypothetical protein n=1 Tax=Pantanalinema sp. GBBB05 TaxID=2604139 RepID=UPI001D5C9726|nr:hypothetical protein [Pantanalinema sp. GBBB05]